MKYEELINKINNSKDGFAKGYDVSFLQDVCCGYSNGAEKFDNIIAGDMQLFKKIEQNIAKREEPADGDFVELEDGKFARITIYKHGGTFQLSNKIGIYVSANGLSSASGSTWDSDFDYIESERLTLDNLKPTSKTKKGQCWTFSGRSAGTGRGVYSEINFKVWLLG